LTVSASNQSSCFVIAVCLVLFFSLVAAAAAAAVDQIRIVDEGRKLQEKVIDLATQHHPLFEIGAIS